MLLPTNTFYRLIFSLYFFGICHQSIFGCYGLTYILNLNLFAQPPILMLVSLSYAWLSQTLVELVKTKVWVTKIKQANKYTNISVLNQRIFLKKGENFSFKIYTLTFDLTPSLSYNTFFEYFFFFLRFFIEVTFSFPHLQAFNVSIDEP